MKKYFCLLVLCLSMLNSAIAKDGYNYSKQSSRFKSMLETGEYEALINVLEKRTKAELGWQGYFWLGTSYLLQGRLLDAEAALDIALELEGSVAEIWIQRAVVALESDNAEASLQLLNVAQQMKPNCAELYLNAAYAYEHLGQADKARSSYGQYLKLSADTPGKGRMRQLVLSRLTKMQNTDPG